MTGIHQFFCDTVGKKGLSGADSAQKQKILKAAVKVFDEHAGVHHAAPHDFPIFSLIPGVGKGMEILFFQNLLQMRLVVEKIDFSLQEAVSFFFADIAGIPAVRTGINRLQIGK